MTRIVLIFLAFAFIHSLMAGEWFKESCLRTLGNTFMRVFYRAVYFMISMITVVIAFALMADVPDQKLWVAPIRIRWIMHGIQLAGLAFGALAFKYIDTGEFLGLKQIQRYFIRQEQSGNREGLTQQELVFSSVYGIVRHPMYLAGIIIFTFNPNITVNSLTITILADLYFVFGTFIEERRFVKMFGNQYREYMKRVPRLTPRFPANPEITI